MKIFLDFDGTVVDHQYPNIGDPNPGCFEVIRKLQDAGHEIILNTYRVETGKKQQQLKKVFEYFNKNNAGIRPLQKFTSKKINPGSWNVEYSKLSNEIFIDDYCFGIPLRSLNSKFVVDWQELDKVFVKENIYANNRIGSSKISDVKYLFPLVKSYDLNLSLNKLGAIQKLISSIS